MCLSEALDLNIIFIFKKIVILTQVFIKILKEENSLSVIVFKITIYLIETLRLSDKRSIITNKD